jgi:hypothetical protein
MPTIIRVQGEDRTDYLLDGTLSVDAQIGARKVARFTLIDRFKEDYRPEIRQTVRIIRDEQTATGSMTGGLLTDTTLVVPSASFTSADVGKIVEVPEAGPIFSVLRGVILEALSSTSVRLNRHAYQTATDVEVRWGWHHFAGLISAVGERAMVDDVGILTPVSAIDFTQICDRRLVTESYGAGVFHDSLLNDIGVKYLDSNGLNIDE